MARNMVTRTVHGTQVNIKVVDPTTEQIVEDTVLLNKKYTEVNDVLKKAVTKALEDGLILVSITGLESVDKCYGISVADFMEHAIEIDPSTRYAISEDDAEDDAE